MNRKWSISWEIGAIILPHNFPSPCVLLHLAGQLLLGPRPLAYTCHHGNSGQLVGREPSAGVLRVWHGMCVGQIILVLKLALRQSGWPISFSGKEAVKQRVSCCLGWVRGSCSSGTRTGLYRHGCFGLSGWLAEERSGEVWRNCDDEKRQWLRNQHGEEVLLRAVPTFSAVPWSYKVLHVSTWQLPSKPCTDLLLCDEWWLFVLSCIAATRLAWDTLQRVYLNCWLTFCSGKKNVITFEIWTGNCLFIVVKLISKWVNWMIECCNLVLVIELQFLCLKSPCLLSYLKVLMQK